MPKPDYRQYARDYLDALEQQMKRAMTDPKSIEATLALWRKMADTSNHGHASAASEPAHDAIARLERRVAKLERDLAELHAPSSVGAKPAKRSTPRAKPKQAKPAPAKKGQPTKKAKPRKR